MRSHTATLQRRLAGIAFEAVAPQRLDELPRMDVALFAGFAARGPVGVPVAVEDARQFADVFGGDAPIAWDSESGTLARAQLAGAVQLFFANGGRRCWVIRLARDAQTSVLRVPGVARIDAAGVAAPLALAAASPGRWADTLTLASSVTSARAGFVGWLHGALDAPSAVPVGVELQLAGRDEFVAGDLLRLTWPGSGRAWYAGIASVEPSGVAQDANRRRVKVLFDGAVQVLQDARWPASLSGRARWQAGAANAKLVPAQPPQSPPRIGPAVELVLEVPAWQAPDAGEVLIADFGADQLLFAVTQAMPDPAAPATRSVRLRGTGAWRSNAGPAPADPPSIERLRLGLWARDGEGERVRIDELGLGPSHPRHPHRLPSDAQVQAQSGTAAWSDLQHSPVAGAMPTRLDDAGEPVDDAGLCLPFAVQTLAGPALTASHTGDAALVRDGLEHFDAALFGDGELLWSFAATLLADAEDLRMRPGPSAREPAGLHAALFVEEASLICVPDAVQPGWLLDAAPDLQQPDPPAPPAADANDDDFSDCGLRLAAPPTLSGETLGGRTVRLHWTGTAAGPYVLEEARQRDWSDATVAWQGDASEAVLDGRAAGDAFYRVRSIASGGTAWSNGVALRIAAGDAGWRMRRPDEFDDTTLRAIHRLLLRLVLARGDALALLALPLHYREDRALAHPERIAAGELGNPTDPADPNGVPPLGGLEASAFDFAALYHGWVDGRGDDGVLRTASPEGAAAGLIAQRANERGAWVAPANEPLRGVVALVHGAAPPRWQELLDAQINVLRHEARGFLVLSADTLADDADLRPINVRRLLTLLRRAAVRLGAGWVFEPNDDSFRRGVERSFEAMLGEMFRRGAFAGATAPTAFQVVTDASVNTPASVDAGRFIVELRVAPSRPMSFLTIRLTQSGDRLVATGS